MAREPGNLREEERDELRRSLGAWLMEEQARMQREGVPLITVLVELISALMSLAAYAAKHNAQLSKNDFIRIARTASFEQWK